MIKQYLRHCAAALLFIAAPFTHADDVNAIIVRHIAEADAMA